MVYDGIGDREFGQGRSGDTPKQQSIQMEVSENGDSLW